MTTAQLNASITAFVQNYNGNFVDHDGKFGNQCWDLAARYASEVLACPALPTRPIPPGGAVDCYNYFLEPLSQFFTKHATGSIDPVRGDLIIWSGAVSGGDGHIAIFLQPLAGGFVALSQNAPLGSPVALRNFTWNNVIGLLRPKAVGVINMDEVNRLNAEVGKLYTIANQTNINLDKLYTICHNNNVKFDQLLTALHQQDLDFSKEVQYVLSQVRERATNAQLAEIKASIEQILGQAPALSAASMESPAPEAPKVSLLTKLLSAFVKPKDNVQA